MEKYDFSKYFKEDDTKYYEPQIMITILTDILGKGLNAIKSELDKLEINVTSEQIEGFLDNTFEEENSEVKRRIEMRNLENRSRYTSTPFEIDPEVEATKLSDKICASRYTFTPDSLKYFEKYSNIVRNKAKKILDIIEKIANKDYSTIVDLLVELDIELDENMNISKEDIVRLILPFIYNYNQLIEKINQANDLKTYLTFKKTSYILARRDVNEEELYPTEDIQVIDLFSCSPSNVPLSAKQKKRLRENDINNIQHFTEILFKAL